MRGRRTCQPELMQLNVNYRPVEHVDGLEFQLPTYAGTNGRSEFLTPRFIENGRRTPRRRMAQNHTHRF